MRDGDDRATAESRDPWKPWTAFWTECRPEADALQHQWFEGSWIDRQVMYAGRACRVHRVFDRERRLVSIEIGESGHVDREIRLRWVGRRLLLLDDEREGKRLTIQYTYQPNGLLSEERLERIDGAGRFVRVAEHAWDGHHVLNRTFIKDDGGASVEERTYHSTGDVIEIVRKYDGRIERTVRVQLAPDGTEAHRKAVDYAPHAQTLVHREERQVLESADYDDSGVRRRLTITERVNVNPGAGVPTWQVRSAEVIEFDAPDIQSSRDITRYFELHPLGGEREIARLEIEHEYDRAGVYLRTFVVERNLVTGRICRYVRASRDARSPTREVEPEDSEGSRKGIYITISPDGLPRIGRKARSGPTR